METEWSPFLAATALVSALAALAAVAVNLRNAGRKVKADLLRIRLERTQNELSRLLGGARSLLIESQYFTSLKYDKPEDARRKVDLLSTRGACRCSLFARSSPQGTLLG